MMEGSISREELLEEEAKEELQELSSEAKVLIATASIGGVILFACLLFAVWYFCCNRSKKDGGYASVRHTLDHEEKQFQRHIEDDTANIDDLFFFDDDGDGAGIDNADVSFERSELEQLKLLDEYRARLASGNPADTAELEADGWSKSTPRARLGLLGAGTSDLDGGATVPVLAPPASDLKKEKEKKKKKEEEARVQVEVEVGDHPARNATTQPPAAPTSAIREAASGSTGETGEPTPAALVSPLTDAS